LSAYWHTFREVDRTTNTQGERLIGCSFDVVWQRYCFDRQLRLLVMDAIERIEVTIRTSLSYGLAHERRDPFGYVTDVDALPKIKGRPKERAELLQRIEEETDRAHEVFKDKFFVKYGDSHRHLPIWMATEIMTFRTILTLFQAASNNVKQAVAASFGVHHSVFSSWLLTLNTVRNVCAHHGRLWNRQFGNSPTIPTGQHCRHWNTPVLIKHSRMFAVLTMINHCINNIAPEVRWTQRFVDLLSQHQSVPIKYMGFPDNWRTSPLWTAAGDREEPTLVPTETQFPAG